MGAAAPAERGCRSGCTAPAAPTPSREHVGAANAAALQTPRKGRGSSGGLQAGHAVATSLAGRRRACFSGAHVSFVGDLTGNAFDCPLPPGAAELCNATCLGNSKPTLRHVVLGRWTDDATDAATAAALACLRALPPRVPEILSYDVGADENITAGNFDFGVVGTFASKAAFEAYEASAPHRACLALLAPVLAEKAAVEQAL